jgi:selenocysteine lyase/cysteine desulfurase
LLEVGIQIVSLAVQSLGDQIADGAQELGFELLGRRSVATGAGIVSIRKQGLDAQLIVKRLKDKGIIAAPRQGWVRLSPHFYISPEEIDLLLEELRNITAA